MVWYMCMTLFGATPADDPVDQCAVVPLIEDYEPEQLFLSLMRVTEEQYAERATTLDALDSADAWRQRQEYVRETLIDMMGGLPERTPLNPRVVGVLERDGYRVENVIFESRPEFYVTANVYVPTRGAGPYPALLSPCGHSHNGKAYEGYQRAYISAAKQGYVVLAFDPISQGERLQILDESGGSVIGIGTGEHCHQGNQGYLIGLNLAQIRIGDAMRCLDYLESREDVDATRFGVMGNSGGGTVTTYLCAVDPRVAVGSPNCYITTLRRRFLSRVTADPEQNFIPQIARGIDHSDLLSVMAPRPVQIGAAIRDFFPIEGAREAHKELERAYAAVDAPDAVEIVEVDEQHGFTLGLREAMIRWMNLHLQHPTPDYTEPEIGVEEDAALQCTETGQVLTSLGGTTVFDIYREAATARISPAASLGDAGAVDGHRDATLASVQGLLGWERPEGPLHAQTLETRSEDGLRVEKVVFTSEAGIHVPTLVVRADGHEGRLPAVVYVHEDGKSADMDSVRRLARNGAVVIAIDPRGMGETKSRHDHRGDYYARYGVETDLTYTSFMIGLPLLGLRARDIVRAVDYAVSRDDVDPSDVSLLGVGLGAAMALHAALLDVRVSAVTARRSLISYKSLALNELYDCHVNVMVPGVIGRYDLSDLVAGIAPRPVRLAETLDHMKTPADTKAIEAEYAMCRAAYSALGAEGVLHLQ
ncbi:hypothetical protein HN371_21600 [Candidatus Poribacteria bacterium]|nr:hypothetical protein [Candidatus Poribacteria bacterium]MBT7806085.1 hypothetical protein [Candidatus Poribacteria bacterium]